jgi:signal transduction histidine kinase
MDDECAKYRRSAMPMKEDREEAANSLAILLVEDRKADYILTRELLTETFGDSFDLDWVKTRDAALEALGSVNYDVCLIDYRLGKWTGLDLLRQAVTGGAKVPFIMLTGQDNREIDVEAMQAGAADYLAKDDISAPVLKRSVRLALARQEHLTAERESQELLKKANLKLSDLYNTAHQFVDNVSHEFRTPLAVIKDFASILHEGLAGAVNEEQKEYLGIVINRVDDLAVMVDDMLDISKLEAGLLCVARQEASLERIFEDVRTTLERKAAANGAALKISVASAVPTVYCDAEKIGRVITNLAVNAFKFSDKDGEVSLWARHDPKKSQVVVGVTDKGPGIAPENAKAIFDRFKQVGGDIRSSTKGFGLGLNIVKELVHLNFGDITVESKLGKGSTFAFTIPTFDPPKVLERFMERIDQFRNGSSFVSLITARAVPEADAVLNGDVEQFLQSQLRRTDLMFKAGNGKWLLGAATSQQQLDQVLVRLGEAWKDANLSSQH